MSRRCRLLLAALGLAGLLGPLGAGASAAVYLHASVNLASTACTLGELAVIASDVPALQERLARVEVARPQGPALISAEQLRRSITEQYGGGEDMIGSRLAVIPRGAVP